MEPKLKRSLYLIAAFSAAALLASCGSPHRADPFGVDTSNGSGSGSGSPAPTPTVTAGGSSSWPTVWPTYIIWKNGGMPPAPNSFFQYTGITYVNGVGSPGGLEMRVRGAASNGPADNVNGDPNTLMISDTGTWVPSPMIGFPNICQRTGPGTASVGFFTCPMMTYSTPYVACYDGVTNTVAYMNTGGKIEFDLKMEAPNSKISVFRIEYGKNANCLFYKLIYPSQLSSTQFTHFAIDFNDSVFNCPVNDPNLPYQIAFSVTAFLTSLACGDNVFSVNDIRYVNY